MAERALLLDTHIWIWFAEGAAAELSAGCARVVEAARESRRAFVSAVSVREVALLVKHKRLRLSAPAGDWARRALGPIGLTPLPLHAEAAALSAELPGEFHRDPADQMLVAQAIVHDLVLVTRDGAILDYAGDGYVHVLDASRGRR